MDQKQTEHDTLRPSKIRRIDIITKYLRAIDQNWTYEQWRRQGRAKVSYGLPYKFPARLLVRFGCIVICKL